MTARPITEGERAEALELARYLVRRFEEDDDARNVPTTELMLARALLSTSSEVRRLREALEKAAKIAEIHAARRRDLAREFANNPPLFSEQETARVTALNIACDIRAALSVEGEDKQARATPSAPISTDTKDTTR